MSETSGPVYQLEIAADPEVADELEDWLDGYVDRLLALPGFLQSRTWSLDDDGGTRRRILQFSVDSNANLRQFLETAAIEYRDELKERFGDRSRVSARVLRGGAERNAEFTRCLNCEVVVTGQYCGACGQRSQSRLISLWELLRDAVGDLFELDSRLWRTLIPLAVRPGQLTSDYLRGRRARFMPPFRMYLVLSLAFFVVAFFDPSKELGILFEAPSPTDVYEADRPAADTPVDAGGEAPAEDSEPRLVIAASDSEDEGLDCDLEDFDNSDWPDWLARRMTRERVETACRNIASDEGSGWEGLFDRALDYVPAGLFILLPVMALLLKVLHPLSGKYYVEHLLFVIHYHAFVFLALTVEILFSRTVAVLELPTAIAEATGVVVAVYIPVYLYKSLRRVYGQGRFLTAVRFVLLDASYVVGLALIVGFSAALAAFNV